MPASTSFLGYNMQLLRLIILLLLCVTTQVQADVEYIEVVSIGHGMTLPDAVNVR